jgi:hypothetical protein
MMPTEAANLVGDVTSSVFQKNEGPNELLSLYLHKIHLVTTWARSEISISNVQLLHAQRAIEVFVI